jgi:hypothetical protein
MKKYMVETVSMFRMRYVVEAEDAAQASDDVMINRHRSGYKEFSQEHKDEFVFSTRELNHQEYLRLFDEDNGYLKSWSDEEKLKFINKAVAQPFADAERDVECLDHEEALQELSKINQELDSAL